MAQPVIQSEFNKHILKRVESLEKNTAIAKTAGLAACWGVVVAIVLIIVLSRTMS